MLNIIFNAFKFHLIIIIYNKTMENHNELITHFIVQTIIKSFENELKIKKLLEMIPLFNTKTF